MQPSTHSLTPRKVVIPNFYLAFPTFQPSSLNPSLIPPTPNSFCSWMLHPEAADPTSRHFPVLLNADGSPWVDGNRYLIHRALHRQQVADATIIQVAADLNKFREILEHEGIDYLSDHKIKIMRPTYAAKMVLLEKVKNEGFSQQSANRILLRAVDFYEFLTNETDIRFKYTLYKTTYKNQPYENNLGQISYKKIRMTDLTLRRIKEALQFDGTIYDGEKLKPLPPVDVTQLLTALAELRNTEMTLAFLIALTTGARLQTVFTLRRSLINKKISPNGYIPIAVGHGTKTNTKYNKKLSLLLPNWLHERIKKYATSERAKKRQDIAQNELGSSDNQYLFLTKTGQPYYMHSGDPEREKFLTPPAGGSVRKFISNQLIPQLRKQGSNFKLKFHDLRATFGMSIVRSGIGQIERGELTLDELLAHVMMRMGHTDITVTMRYLRYDYNEDLVQKAQWNWEQLCSEMTRRGYELLMSDE